jgi:SAM-dependent methyltransferase
MALRDTFDEAPELYDRVRPGYPEAVFEDLTTLARLRPGSRVLELGCGTGQATVPLAARGLEVVASRRRRRRPVLRRGAALRPVHGGRLPAL